MNPLEVVIDDLARQVAQKAVESAEWRARALLAEEALAEAMEEEMEKDRADD